MITIYSKEGCGQCVMAKQLCERNNIEYSVKMLDVDYTRASLMSLVPSVKSFPVIFNGDEYLGGFNELRTFLFK